MSVYKKLADIQKELFVPKGNRNDFGNYNYRSCEDILKTVKPLCEKHGCVLHMTNDLVNIGERNYVEACCTLVDLESSESVYSKAHAREDEDRKGMSGDQLTGAASSYARKYALAGLFCIDNEKDSDATNTHGAESDKPIVAEEMGKLKLEMLRTGVTEEAICERNKIASINDLTHKQYEATMKGLAKTKDRDDSKN